MMSFPLSQTQHGAARKSICHRRQAFSVPSVHASQGSQQQVLHSTACRARLPHMDEEIEHMQWQLDRRNQEDRDKQRKLKQRSSKSAGSNGRPKSAKQVQHVFHDRPHHHGHHQRLSPHRAPAAADVEAVIAAASSNAASVSVAEPPDHTVWPSQQTTEEEAATAASMPPAAAAAHYYQQRQQQATEQAQLQLQLQQQVRVYYHLQLQHITDLSKACDRLSKHIQQDGGCYISAGLAESSNLIHLLLLVQHKQQISDPQCVMVLQPVDCPVGEPTSNTPGRITAVSATAAGLEVDSTVVQVSRASHHHKGVCSTDDPIKLWLAAMPLPTLIALQAEPIGRGAGAGAAAVSDHGSSSSPSGSSSPDSSSVFDGSLTFSAESDTDEPSMLSSPAGTVIVSANDRSSNTPTGTRHNSSGSSSSIQSSRGKVAADAALLAAATSSSSSVAALLQYSSTSSGLKHVRIGSHADAAMVASATSEAVSAGRVTALHVKGHPAAHAVSFAALQVLQASAATMSEPSASLSMLARSSTFGVMIVPGAGHEHVHAVSHSHVASEAASGLGHVLPGHKGDHSSRVQSDASMAVGGFGAAFYGLESDDRAAVEHGALQHKHAQEIWLCVVPFTEA